MNESDLTQPLFDSSRKALSFALNHARSLYSQPLMTKAANVLAKADAEAPTGPKRDSMLAGLDGAGQAGLIYIQLNKLADAQIHALVARVAVHSFPCACRTACCMGSRPNPEWTTAIQKLSEFAKAVIDAEQADNKKKTHLPPQLRRMMVEKYFGRKYRVSDMAELFSMSETTVINHRKPVTEVLLELEKSGWTALDEYLTNLNLVGFKE